MGQPRPDILDFSLSVDELILPVSDRALVGIVEHEIGVIFLVMTGVDNFDLRIFEGFDDDLRIADLHLGLHLVALGLGRAADGDQFGEH